MCQMVFLRARFLYYIFINSLAKTIDIFNNSIRKSDYFKKWIYADDVQLLCSCNPEKVDSCVEHINNCLSRINSWASQNSLLLNPNKTKCIIISKNKFKLPQGTNIILDGKNVEVVDTVRNLGLTFFHGAIIYIVKLVK